MNVVEWLRRFRKADTGRVWPQPCLRDILWPGCTDEPVRILGPIHEWDGFTQDDDQPPEENDV